MVNKFRSLNPVWWLVGALTLLGATAYGIQESRSASLSELPKMQEEMFLPSVQLGKFCSGTVIYSDRDKNSGLVNTIVLTAKHCVEKPDQFIQVGVSTYNKSNRMISETLYSSKVFGMNVNSDLALLKLTDQQTIFKTAAVAPRETGESLLFGQDVFSVSYPLGGSLTLTVGTLGRVERVDAFKSHSKSTEFYRTTPNIAPGSSGSALFQNTTGKYELIGVLTGTMHGFPFINFYTPIEEIQDYLDVARKAYEVPKDTPDVGVKND